MDYIKTEIEGVYIIEPKVFNDTRGYFMEAWKQAEFNEHIGKVDFIQDNESKSSFGVLRGLHYQKGSTSQSKLVRVIKGKVLYVWLLISASRVLRLASMSWWSSARITSVSSLSPVVSPMVSWC